MFFHLLHLFFVLVLFIYVLMATLEAIIRNEPCQPSPTSSLLKVQWSFRCWWASGSWTTARERDLDDWSRTLTEANVVKIPSREKETTALIALLGFLQMFFSFRWWWYIFAEIWWLSHWAWILRLWILKNFWELSWRQWEVVLTSKLRSFVDVFFLGDLKTAQLGANLSVMSDSFVPWRDGR